MGGRGVTIISAFQSRAQLLDRYGDAKAEVILNNSGGILVSAAPARRDDLTYWSTLGGDRDEPITTTDLHGRVASRTPAPGARAAAGPDRQPARRDGGRVPPRDAAGHRAAEQAWRRRDVHAHHHPDALTVRARAALARWRAAVRAWAWGIAEPAITWGAAGTRAVDAAIAAAWRGSAAGARPVARPLHRLFGTATPAPYTPPGPAPRLHAVTTADITTAIEEHRRARGLAPETHLRPAEQNPAGLAGEQQQEGSA